MTFNSANSVISKDHTTIKKKNVQQSQNCQLVSTSVRYCRTLKFNVNVNDYEAKNLQFDLILTEPFTYKIFDI